jgi:3-dehydroquinate dehydratase II
VPSVWVLNGPNLGQLGRREAVYGTGSYADLVAVCTEEGQQLQLDVEVRQTDDEATMLGWLHTCTADGVLLNPAGWTHTSVAVRDAAATLTVPFVEVHLSNPMAREEFRHTSLTAGLASGSVAGFGLDSYRLGLRGLAGLLSPAS